MAIHFLYTSANLETLTITMAEIGAKALSHLNPIPNPNPYPKWEAKCQTPGDDRGGLGLWFGLESGIVITDL